MNFTQATEYTHECEICELKMTVNLEIISHSSNIKNDESNDIFTEKLKKLFDDYQCHRKDNECLYK